MQLKTIDEITLSNYKHICKESSLSHLIVILITIVFTILLIYVFFQIGAPLVLLCVSFPFLLIYLYMQFCVLKKTRSKSNWVLAINDKGLLIKFRSYLRAHYPAQDKQVVFVPYEEIKNAKIFRKKITYSNMHRRGNHSSQNKESEIFLDIKTDNIDLSELKQCLKQEREKENKGEWTFKHYPVTVSEDNIIRIEWKMKHTKIVPNMDKVVQVLSFYDVLIVDSLKKSIDFTNQDVLQSDDLQDQIIELIEQGKGMAATKIVMKAYNWDLTKARNFVESLMN